MLTKTIGGIYAFWGCYKFIDKKSYMNPTGDDNNFIRRYKNILTRLHQVENSPQAAMLNSASHMLNEIEWQRRWS